MAKITTLPEKPVLDGTETLIVIDNGVAKRTPGAALSKSVTAKAQEWAEGAGAPGGAGTKSARGWAADAAAAIASVPEFSAERVALNSPRVRNVFNKGAAFAGTAINRLTGTRSASSPVFTTGLMAVRPGDPLISDVSSYYTTTVGMVYSDQAKKPILPGPAAALTAGVPVTVPAGAYYVEIPYLNSAVPNPSTLMVLNSDTVPSSYIEFGEPALFPWLVRAQVQARALQPARGNLFKIEEVITGLLGRNNGVITANPDYSISNYIPVIPGVPFKTHGARPQPVVNWGMTYFDKDKVVIPGVGLGGPFTDGQEFIPPPNSAFVQINCRTTEIEDLVVLPSGVAKRTLFYHKPAHLSDFRQWAGLKFVHLEDSFGYGANWQYELYAYLGAKMTINASANGRRMADALKDVYGNVLSAADFAEVHGVYLKLGTNDYNYATPLGSYSDGPDAATYYGQARKAIETMLGYNKYLRINVGTTHQRILGPATNPVIGAGTGPNSAGFTTRDYSAALRAVAQDYSSPIIDYERVSGLNTITMGTFTEDGLHPNITGGGRTACLLNPAKAHFDRTYPVR